MTNNGFGGHRHGVTKNILEGLGGMVVGAAAVLFLVGAAKSRRSGAAEDRPTDSEG